MDKKIDMSLEDIIKMNRKSKRVAANKAKVRGRQPKANTKIAIAQKIKAKYSKLTRVQRSSNRLANKKRLVNNRSVNNNSRLANNKRLANNNNRLGNKKSFAQNKTVGMRKQTRVANVLNRTGPRKNKTNNTKAKAKTPIKKIQIKSPLSEEKKIDMSLDDIINIEQKAKKKAINKAKNEARIKVQRQGMVSMSKRGTKTFGRGQPAMTRGGRLGARKQARRAAVLQNKINRTKQGTLSQNRSRQQTSAGIFQPPKRLQKRNKTNTQSNNRRVGGNIAYIKNTLSQQERFSNQSQQRKGLRGRGNANRRVGTAVMDQYPPNQKLRTNQNQRRGNFKSQRSNLNRQTNQRRNQTNNARNRSNRQANNRRGQFRGRGGNRNAMSSGRSVTLS